MQQHLTPTLQSRYLLLRPYALVSGQTHCAFRSRLNLTVNPNLHLSRSLSTISSQLSFSVFVHTFLSVCYSLPSAFVVSFSQSLLFCPVFQVCCSFLSYFTVPGLFLSLNLCCSFLSVSIVPFSRLWLFTSRVLGRSFLSAFVVPFFQFLLFLSLSLYCSFLSVLIGPFYRLYFFPSRSLCCSFLSALIASFSHFCCFFLSVINVPLPFSLCGY